MQRQVTIGPEFFAKAKNDYSDWRWAIVREFVQNCGDCGSRKIEFEIAEAGGKTTLVCRNDGEPMTEEILVNKFFALGASGKNFTGTNVGGFGKAKEILAFCHDSYQIRTGNLLVVGSGAGYDLQTDVEYFAGTETAIVMAGELADEMIRKAKRLAGLCQTKAKIVINGEQVEGRLLKGKHRTDLPFGGVYTNHDATNLLVVRIGGVPMFTQCIDYKWCVVVEMNGMSKETMTANRDGLVYPHRSTLNDFVVDLSVDKRKALKPAEPLYERFDGPKLGYQGKPAEPAAAPIASGELEVAAKSGFDVSDAKERLAILLKTFVDDAPTASETAEEEAETLMDSEFFIKNELGRKLPAGYRPDSGKMLACCKKLARTWGRLMVALHKEFDIPATFSIGFIFSDEVEAQFESDPHGRIYFINPAKITDGKFTYRFANDSVYRVLMDAVHEFVHGGCGLQRHDEEYAGRLTDVSATAMQLFFKGKLRWCFK